MTNEQLLQLKEMSPWEIVKKYFPMLSSGQITKGQYDYLLKKAAGNGQTDHDALSDQEIKVCTNNTGDETTHSELNDTTQLVLREFGGYVVPEAPRGITSTTHPEPPRGSSQKARIWNLLSDKGWHSTVEIMNVAYSIRKKFGICRVAARINDLKNDGWDIESKMEGTICWYRLTNY